jgi:hypothetical protein
MSTKRIVLTVLVAFVVLIGVAVYFTFDPSNPTLSKFFPKCPVYSFTGFKCPGCGTQRAIHAILNGDLVRAAHYNALLLVAIPLIALYWFADLTRKRWPALDNALNHPVAIILLLVVVVAWLVLRNIFGW